MKIVFSFLVLLSLTFSVDSYSLDNKTVAAMMKNMKIDKQQLAGMIDMLVKTGQITKKQADDAKKNLNKMSDEQFEQLKLGAVDIIENADQGSNADKKDLKTVKKELEGDSKFKKMVDEELKKKK